MSLNSAPSARRHLTDLFVELASLLSQQISDQLAGEPPNPATEQKIAEMTDDFTPADHQAFEIFINDQYLPALQAEQKMLAHRRQLFADNPQWIDPAEVYKKHRNKM